MNRLNEKYIFKQKLIIIIFLLISHIQIAAANNNPNFDPRQFFQQLQEMTLQQREEAIFEQVLNGNIPSFLSQLVPVKVSFNLKSGRPVQGVVNVMPDYFAVGSDSDFVRVPMTPILAQRIAKHLGYILPTKKIVDAIYEQADIKLTPQPMPYDSEMVTPNRFYLHDQIIKAQQPEFLLGTLIAGHKKDIIVSKKLETNVNHVAIYGWHQPNGKPIQNLSLAHDNLYVDYSHGARFISSIIIIDDQEYFIEDLLNDENFSQLISDEGSFNISLLANYTKLY